MKFDKYQKLSARTSAASTTGVTKTSIMVSTLGLIGEAGEVAEHIKKHVGHGHELDKGKVEKELGDVLWYISDLCTQLDLELDQVAMKNVEKLMARYPQGFSEQDSINRSESINKRAMKLQKNILDKVRGE